jgi:hypothetical protein
MIHQHSQLKGTSKIRMRQRGDLANGSVPDVSVVSIQFLLAEVDAYRQVHLAVRRISEHTHLHPARVWESACRSSAHDSHV